MYMCLLLRSRLLGNKWPLNTFIRKFSATSFVNLGWRLTALKSRWDSTTVDDILLLSLL